MAACLVADLLHDGEVLGVGLDSDAAMLVIKSVACIRCLATLSS